MLEAFKKAEALIEALPYLKAFDEKIVVVKLGGSAMTDPSVCKATLTDIVFMEQAGIRPVIVHGGGPHISARLKAAGINSRFIEGLRVTDEATLRIVEPVLMGVNRSIAEEINAQDGIAVQVHGALDRVFEAEKKRLPGKPEVDLGFVGEIVRVNAERVIKLASGGVVPVVSPLGLGEGGQVFNVNADTAASRLAAALKAEKLVFMSNVAGILMNPEDPSSLITTLIPPKVRELIAAKVITGGMLPKVEASLKAMDEGVHKVHVIDARSQHSLLLEIFTNQGVGTQFVKD